MIYVLKKETTAKKDTAVNDSLLCISKVVSKHEWYVQRSNFSEETI